MRAFFISVTAEMVPLSAHDRSAATRRGWTTSAMAWSEPGRLMAARMNPRSLACWLPSTLTTQERPTSSGAGQRMPKVPSWEDLRTNLLAAGEQTRTVGEPKRCVRYTPTSLARPPGVVAPPPGVDEAVGEARELVVPEQPEALAHKWEAHVARREPRTTAPALQREEGAVAGVVAVPDSEREQRNGAEEEADPPRPVCRRHLCVHRHRVDSNSQLAGMLGSRAGGTGLTAMLPVPLATRLAFHI